MPEVRNALGLGLWIASLLVWVTMFVYLFRSTFRAGARVAIVFGAYLLAGPIFLGTAFATQTLGDYLSFVGFPLAILTASHIAVRQRAGRGDR